MRSPRGSGCAVVAACAALLGAGCTADHTMLTPWYRVTFVKHESFDSGGGENYGERRSSAGWERIQGSGGWARALDGGRRVVVEVDKGAVIVAPRGAPLPLLACAASQVAVAPDGRRVVCFEPHDTSDVDFALAIYSSDAELLLRAEHRRDPPPQGYRDLSTPGFVGFLADGRPLVAKELLASDATQPHLCQSFAPAPDGGGIDHVASAIEQDHGCGMRELWKRNGILVVDPGPDR